jgi:DNA-binding transcriptional LysR family regulator
MHVHQLDLNLFSVLEAIHSEGSVTRAGEKLNLSQPAISHSLRRLRDLLKDELFIRYGAKMVPTPLSRRMIGDVRTAMRLLELSVQETGFDPARSTRLFQIGMRNVLQPTVLPPLMRRMQSSAPGVGLSCHRIDRQEIESDLASGTVDLVVDIAIPVSDAIRQTQLSPWAYVVVSRANHPSTSSRMSLKTYLSQGHILVSSRRVGTTLIDIELKNHGARRRVALRCQDYFTACRVASETDLLLTMPEPYARVANADLDNQVHRFPLKTARYCEYLYWHSTADGDPENRWLREQVLGLFKQEPWKPAPNAPRA